MSRRQEVRITKEEEKELQKIIDEINEEAKSVVEDYANNPSKKSVKDAITNNAKGITSP